MANLILASKRETKNGNTMWHVYRSENNNKSDEFWFSAEKPLKALRYAFILRKRHGAIIPKGVYSKLMADVTASKASESAQEQSTAQATESASAPEQGKAKRTPRKRTAKKASTEPSTESK